MVRSTVGSMFVSSPCVARRSGSSRCAVPIGGRSMPLVRMTFAEARKRAEKEPADWDRIDAMTDEDIARQIAEDPDVAPDMSEALERGEFVHLHVVDLFGIRTRMGLSREAFAKRFGLDPVELRDWEAMGGVPDEAIRTYLRVIESEPEAVARAVDAMARDEESGAKRAAGSLSGSDRALIVP